MLTLASRRFLNHSPFRVIRKIWKNIRQFSAEQPLYICSLDRLPSLNDDMKKFETSTAIDMQLLARFEQSRDQSAFAELVRRHGPMVMAAAMRELGNRDDAEDAPNPTSIRVTKSVIGWRCPARVLGFTCTSSLTFS